VGWNAWGSAGMIVCFGPLLDILVPSFSYLYFFATSIT
jgi:hypothetical protein